MRVLPLMLLVVACARPNPKPERSEAPPATPSYCTCKMWGVSGVEPPPPGPDDPPPVPRPAACEEILARGPDPGCPVPQ